MSRREGMCIASDEPAADALTLLRRRIAELPGYDVTERDDGAAGLGLAIDVRRTGLSGYGVARRLRDCHDVRIEPSGDGIVASFRTTRDICDGGTRLLFGLAALV